MPWSALCGLIEPFYPKPGNGRPPVGVERMLRIYFLQQWFLPPDQLARQKTFTIWEHRGCVERTEIVAVSIILLRLKLWLHRMDSLPTDSGPNSLASTKLTGRFGWP